MSHVTLLVSVCFSFLFYPISVFSFLLSSLPCSLSYLLLFSVAKIKSNASSGVVCVWLTPHCVLSSLTAFYLFVSVSVFSTSHHHFSSSPIVLSQPATPSFQLANKSKHRLPSINHITQTGRVRESPILRVSDPHHQQFYTEFGQNNRR